MNVVFSWFFSKGKKQRSRLLFTGTQERSFLPTEYQFSESILGNAPDSKEDRQHFLRGISN
jgi:hypothetical protein